MIRRDLVIVGGGPAGMAAAISAYESGVDDILLLERDQYLGGILNQCVHTGFGIEYFNEVLSGPERFDVDLAVEVVWDGGVDRVDVGA